MSDRNEVKEMAGSTLLLKAVELSYRCFAAQWADRWEDKLWRLLNTQPWPNYFVVGRAYIFSEDMEVLKKASELSGMWVHRPNQAPELIGLEKWKGIE